MSAPAGTMLWLLSRYDNTWHAFAAEHVSEPTRVFYQALCSHSVPVALVERVLPQAFCPKCLVLCGTRVPDGLWRMDP